MKLLYTSTKEYKELAPVSYRQWRADSHCNDWHGYALGFYFEFSAWTLDIRNWVFDYGGLKPLKACLEDWFDHKMLVAEDDPLLDFHRAAEAKGLCRLTVVERTGCEGIADFLIRYINEQWLPLHGDGERVWCSKVGVRETAANMAFVTWPAQPDSGRRA